MRTGRAVARLGVVCLVALAPSLAQESDPTDPWSAKRGLSLPSDGSAAVVEFDVSAAVSDMNVSDALLARASVAGGLGAGTRITLDALHGGLTTSWSLRPDSPSAEALLCSSDPAGPAARPDARVAVVGRIDGAAGGAGGDVEVSVELVKQSIKLRFDERVEATVSPEQPLTLLVDPVSDADASNRDRYILRFGSDAATGDVCAVVSAYAGVCPYKHGEDSVRTADMWFTALDKGAMTIRYEEDSFFMPFYVSVVVLPTDDDCHLHEEPSVKNRTKNVWISISKAQRYQEYLQPISVFFILCALLVLFGFIVMATKRLSTEGVVANDNLSDSVYYSPKQSREELEEADPKRRRRRRQEEQENDEVDTGDDKKEDEKGENGAVEEEAAIVRNAEEGGAGDNSIDPIINSAKERPSRQSRRAARSAGRSTHEDLKGKVRRAAEGTRNQRRKLRIERGLERLNEEARLADMTRVLEDDVWFRRNRSKVYAYLVPLLSLFYFIPSIQFVFLAKESEKLTGSQDLCYHNFGCARPLNIFSDFNHVVSNLPYVIFGLAFLAIVRYKAHILPKEHKPRYDHGSETGILQQLSIFYAMGTALVAQGFFSVCYHVCPTNHSLQFDSTMMYVMCMLGIVKIYQFRHPDANANAYSFFAFLGGIVLLEAIALYSQSWWVFGLFIAFYVCATLFIALDCYYMGVGRLDRAIAKTLARDLFTKWETDPESTSWFQRHGIRYPRRFGFALIFCGFNLLHAVYITVSKVMSPRKSVTHVLLLILAGNLFLYIAYYVFRKNKRRWESLYHAYCSKDDTVDAKSRYSVKIMDRTIPCPINPGTICAASALILGGVAAHFYLSRHADRNLSPAESRRLNSDDCLYLEFYDNHDLWHFASAAAIFMAFLALLTVDDDLLTVNRNDIEVF